MKKKFSLDRLRHLSFGKSVTLLFGVGLSFIAILGLVALVNFERVRQEVHELVESNVSAETLASLQLIEEHQTSAEVQMLTLLVLALVFLVLLARNIIKRINQFLEKLKDSLSILASGYSASVPKVDARTEVGSIYESVAKIGYSLDAINYTQAVIQFNLDGTIINANENFQKTMGYSMSELAGRHHSMFATEAYAKSAEYKQFWEMLNAGETFEGEFGRLGKGGRPVWLRAVYVPILGLNGKPVRVNKYAQDITEEYKQREEVKLISMVADETDNLVIITDKKEKILYVNKGFTKLTGYTREECMGRKPQDFLQGKDTSEETRREIREKLDKNQPFYNEILNYTKDGEAYWVSLSINPVFDSNGNVEKFISVQGDVSANKMRHLENEQGMKESVEVLNKLAEGDLSQLMEGNYKMTFKNIKEAVNHTINKLADVSYQIQENAEMLKNCSSDIASASDDLSTRTENQALTLERTNSAMEGVLSNVQSNTERTQDVNRMSTETQKIAHQGEEIVDKVVLSMNGIAESSTKISDIISMIDEIAFQTNLLALNAAVEAARAGDSGKGFAVVAQEVRALAGRSANSSKEITDLIQDSIQKVESGCELAEKAKSSLGHIMTSFRKQSENMNVIAEASESQLKELLDIKNAITDLDSVTQQNAAMVEETTSACRQLVDLTESVNQLIGYFKTKSA